LAPGGEGCQYYSVLVSVTQFLFLVSSFGFGF